MRFFLSGGVLLFKNNLNTPFLGHMSSSPIFSGVRVTQFLGFCVVFRRSLVVFFLFSLTIVLSVLRLWLLMFSKFSGSD
jgi:hypothetical protein